MRDKPLAVYGRGDHKGGGLALEMTLWIRDIFLCSDGPAELSADCRRRLRGMALRHDRREWCVWRPEEGSLIPR